jgi:hypothetical protein
MATLERSSLSSNNDLVEQLRIAAPKHIQTSEDNPWCICPYNTRHRMPGKSLLGHLKSCPDKPKKKKPQGPLVICPYNSDHKVPQTILDDHKQKCPNRPRPRRNSTYVPVSKEFGTKPLTGTKLHLLHSGDCMSGL